MSLVLSFVILILQSCAIASDSWFTQDSVSIPDETPNYFNGPKGGLLHSKDFKLFSDTETGRSWESLANDCSDIVYGSGLCDELSDFYRLGFIYIAIDACSIIILCLSILLYILHLTNFSLKEKIPLPLVNIFGILCSVLHTAAFIIWSDGVGLTISDCGTVPFEQSHTTGVCASNGANIALSVIPLSCIIPVLYLIYYLKNKPSPAPDEVAMIESNI